MSNPNEFDLPIPDSGFDGLAALITLGVGKLEKLKHLQSSLPLNLELDKLIASLAKQLECQEEVIGTALTEAIIPLNGVRRTFALSPEELVGALQRTIERTDDVEWKETYLASQQELSRALLPFFEPDSFFARVSLAFELLSQRPIAFKQAKIVHDLRPVFNEDNSDLLGLLQTNTLVLRFWDTRNERTLHISLDSGDLESLAKEIDIALKRIEVSKRVAEERKLQLLNDGD